MRCEVRLIRRQYCSQVAQVLKFTQFRIRRPSVGGNGDCKRGLAAKQAKKNVIVRIEEVVDLIPSQQHELQWVAANQAVIAPDRNEARIRVGQCFVKPVCILSHFATAVDECTGEYVVIFHPASVTH